MEIEDKYIKMLGKLVYNNKLNKYGRICKIELSKSVGMTISLRVFYDKFDDDGMLFFEDFENGKIQFVILTDCGLFENYTLHEKFEIMRVLEGKYTDDMIIYMSNDEWKEKLREQDRRNTQLLHTDIVSLTNVSVEVLSDDFYCRELYLKRNEGGLTETQMLYAMVNHLSQEYKRMKDSNSEYFFKYEFGKLLEGAVETYNG